MEFMPFLLKAFLALALGGLIGIDRQKNKQGYPAGIRTLAFVSLIGFLSSFISLQLNSPSFMIIAMALIFALVIVGYGVSYNSEKFIGFTSVIIIFVSFIIGILAYYDEYYYFAVAISIIVSIILNKKDFLHSIVANLKNNELFDALKFGIVAFVILPLLPNETMGSYDIFNPFKMWLLVVLILSISYAGYILSKFMGKKKGIIASGLIGGLVSSTAVASSLSIMGKKNDSLSDACSMGISLANALMFLRIMVWGIIISPAIAWIIGPPLALCSLFGVIGFFLMNRFSKKKDYHGDELISESPFNFIPAIKFSLLITAILFISKIALLAFGDKGIYIAALFGSIADVDAIAISIATLFGESMIDSNAALLAITLAAVTNSIIKLFIIKRAGSKEIFLNSLKNYSLMILPLIIWAVFSII